MVWKNAVQFQWLILLSLIFKFVGSLKSFLHILFILDIIFRYGNSVFFKETSIFVNGVAFFEIAV